MQNLDKISEELFAKIRGRFPSVTIGTADGMITNNPSEARFIEFDYKSKGKVSISLSDDNGLVIMHGADILAGENDEELSNWYSFLKELRVFAKKRMLNFDTRDITKSNLNKRDYNFLAKNNAGEDKMTESKLYGTSKVSYQNVDNARLVIKHTESIDSQVAAGRTRNIGAIYIESSEGERFKYPYKHLSGARAMARHVAEGGKPFDDFGTHIVGLSEEMSKLRKFKNYMGRSAVMAESLAGYMDVVKERISTVKKTIESLQKPAYYAETFAAFEKPMLEDVPADIAENWIDELTIKQFNEELQDVFPYIYKLVGEATKAKDLDADSLMSEMDCWDGYKKAGTQPGTGKNKGKRVNKCVPEEEHLARAFEGMMGQFAEGTNGQEVMNAFQSAAGQLSDIGGYGEPDMKKVMALVTAGKIEDAADEFVGEFTDKDGGEVRGADGIYTDLVHDLLYATGADGSPQEGDEAAEGGCSCEDEAEEEQKTPLGDFILSYYDRETGSFPKGETAILTMVEKDYGDHYVRPAQAFIGKVHETFVQHERMNNNDQNDILRLAGI